MTVNWIHVLLIVFKCSFLSLCLYSIGVMIMRLLRGDVPSAALGIASGIVPFLLVAWYIQFHLHREVLLWSVPIVGCFGFIFYVLLPALRGVRSVRRETVRIIICSGISMLIYIAVAQTSDVMTLANNDIYSWYSAAGTLAGVADYAAMSPGAAQAWNSLIRDAAGTNWLIALAGFGMNDPILEANLFLILLTSWIMMALHGILTRFFKVRSLPAYLCAALPICNPFILYVEFNYFLAQLVATFACITQIEASFALLTKKSVRLIPNCRLLLPPLLVLFCVYQSGFAAFEFIACGAAFSFAMAGGVRRLPRLKMFAVAYAITLVVTLVLLPQVTWHLIKRTLLVSSCIVGWPLPLLPLGFLWNIPFPDGKQSSLWSGLPGEPSVYILVLLFAIAMWLILWGQRSECRRMSRLKRRFAGGWLWLLFLTESYLAWFMMKGPSYQLWKFAAFFSLSLAFVPAATLAYGISALEHAASRYKGRLFFVGRFLFRSGILGSALVVIIVCGSGTRHHLRDITPQIKDLIQIRSAVPYGCSLVIDLPPYGFSMLPMLIMSKKAKLYPLSKTYLQIFNCPKIESSEAISPTRPIYQLFSSKAAHQLVQLDTHAASGLSEVGCFAFRPFEPILFTDCSSRMMSSSRGDDVQFARGFSGPESWGRWSDGDEASIVVPIPPDLSHKNLRFSLKICAFTPPSVQEQRFSMSINGRGYRQFAISRSKTITLNVDVAEAQDTLRLYFRFETPLRPMDYVSGSTDTRRIAIGFISLLLKPEKVTS